MTIHAPVAVIAFRRPGHLSRVLFALQGCWGADETDVHVFVDGPRSRKDASLVDEVARLAAAATGFHSVTVIRQARNLGLAASVTGAVDRLLEVHDRVIVVEDDIEVGPGFLLYMNDALTLYADDSAVAAIHAYSYPTDSELPDTFFRRGTDCWGWGTWRRAWRIYEPDAALLLRRLEDDGLLTQFDLGGVAPFTDMLRDQAAGRVESWAVRWHASAYLAGMFTLFPARSLARNIGMDGSGQHVGLSGRYDVDITQDAVRVDRIPVGESVAARESLRDFYATDDGHGVEGVRGMARRAAKGLSRRLPVSWRRSIVRVLPTSARRYLR